VQTLATCFIPRFTGSPIDLATPFFWFDPAWHLVDVERAAIVSTALAASGILVSALHRDLAQTDELTAVACEPRMIPHRCDRAGLIHQDFRAASVIDLRLALNRDAHGRFAYPPSQLRRWANQEETPGDFSIDAMTFPPDWRSLDDMSIKVGQLRRLSSAAVFVSLDAFNLPTIWPSIAKANIDGMILRLSGDPLATTMEARQLIHASNGAAIQLWIATDRELSAEDCVKCFAMGANGIAVDAMCNGFLHKNDQFEMTTAERAARSFGYGGGVETDQRIFETARKMASRFVADVCGYAHSCGVDRLSSLCPTHLTRVQR